MIQRKSSNIGSAVLFLVLIPQYAVNSSIADCNQCQGAFIDNVQLTFGETTYVTVPKNLATCQSATCVWTITGPTDSVLRLVFSSGWAFQMNDLDSVSVFNHSGTAGSPILRCTSFEATCFPEKWMTTTSNTMTVVLNHQNYAKYDFMNMSVTAVKPFACGLTTVPLTYTGLSVLKSADYPYTTCLTTTTCEYDVQSLSATSFVFMHVMKVALTGGSSLSQYDIIDGNRSLMQECFGTDQCGDRTSKGTMMHIVHKCEMSKAATNQLNQGSSGVQLYLDDRVKAPSGTQHCGPLQYQVQHITPGTSQVVNSAGYPEDYCGHGYNLYRYTTEVGSYLHFSTIGTPNLKIEAYNDLNADANSERAGECSRELGPAPGYNHRESRNNEMSVRLTNPQSTAINKFQFNVTSVRICPPLAVNNLTGTTGCGDDYRSPPYCAGGEYRNANCKTLYMGSRSINWTTNDPCYLDPSSTVEVFDGTDSSTGKLLKRYTHSDCPRSSQLTATSGSMFIQYTSKNTLSVPSGSRPLSAQTCWG